jgi:hypothetical protein
MGDFEEKIKLFVDKKKPCIHILTPCYNASCYTLYVSSLLQTYTLCKEYGIDIRIDFCDTESLITRARNNMTAKAMSNPKMTHIMFIDADIEWKPMDIIRMLLDNEMVLGGIYPKKRYAWEKLENRPNLYQECQQKKNNIQSPLFENSMTSGDLFQNCLLNYNFRSNLDTITVSNNKMEVEYLANGFMMIQRPVIETMQKAFPHTKYEDNTNILQTETEKNNAYALFDCSIENGEYLSEDWLFCARWKEMGGTIHANVSVQLNHIGIETFQGSFIRSVL